MGHSNIGEVPVTCGTVDWSAAPPRARVVPILSLCKLEKEVRAPREDAPGTLSRVRCMTGLLFLRVAPGNSVDPLASERFEPPCVDASHPLDCTQIHGLLLARPWYSVPPGDIGATTTCHAQWRPIIDFTCCVLQTKQWLAGCTVVQRVVIVEGSSNLNLYIEQC